MNISSNFHSKKRALAPQTLWSLILGLGQKCIFSSENRVDTLCVSLKCASKVSSMLSIQGKVIKVAIKPTMGGNYAS